MQLGLKNTSTFSVDFNPERKKLEKGIVKQEKRALGLLRQVALSNSDRLIDREILKEVIVETSHRWTGCLMLPVTILFFTFYSVAAALHEDIPVSHFVEAPVRDILMPPIDMDDDPLPGMLQAVNTLPRVYDFLQTKFLPTFLSQLDSFNMTMQKKDYGTILKYNQLQGLVIFELQRSKKERCKAPASHVWCYPEEKLSNESFGMPWARMVPSLQNYTEDLGPDGEPILKCADEGFTILGCSSPPQETRRLWAMLRDDFKAPKWNAKDQDKLSYRFAFNPNASWAVTMARFEYLKERGFLDDSSIVLQAKAYYLNYQFEAPILETVKVIFSFTRGGGVRNNLWMMGHTLDTFVYPASYVFDILFILMLLGSIGMLSFHMFKTAQNNNGSIKNHFSAVNIVAWLSVLFGLFIVFLIVGASTSRKELKKNIQAYQQDPTEANAYDLADTADSFSGYMSFVHVIVCYGHLVFMVRCFISLKWQPRLAVVARTINKMSSDLFHFLIVLIPTFIAFAIAGMVMFGRRLRDWSSMQSALITCFKIAIENQFRWAELSAVDFITSIIWVWVFVPLVVLLMLNMVLAIIMDIYQEVRREAGDTMTIPRHLTYIYMAIAKRADWVTEKQLYSIVSNMSPTISTLELRQAFPSMPDYQGEYLITECKNKAKYITRCGVDPGASAGLIAAVHVSLEEMLNDISNMKARGWMGMGFEVPNPAERECVKDILTSVAMQQHWMQLTQKAMGNLQGKIEGIEEEDNPKRKPDGKSEEDSPKRKPDGRLEFKIGSE